ncbi:hypothetical protein D3C73_1331570 [compost metagenome]
MECRTRQQQHFGQEGDQARLIHFSAALVKQCNYFAENAFHAAPALNIRIQSLKRDAIHGTVDKGNSGRLVCKIILCIVYANVSFTRAQYEVNMAEFSFH